MGTGIRVEMREDRTGEGWSDCERGVLGGKEMGGEEERMQRSDIRTGEGWRVRVGMSE